MLDRPPQAVPVLRGCRHLRQGGGRQGRPGRDGERGGGELALQLSLPRAGVRQLPPGDRSQAVEVCHRLVRRVRHLGQDRVQLLGRGRDLARLAGVQPPRGGMDVRYGGQLRPARPPPAWPDPLLPGSRRVQAGSECPDVRGPLPV